MNECRKVLTYENAGLFIVLLHGIECTTMQTKIEIQSHCATMVLSILRSYERALAWAPTTTTGFIAGALEPRVFAECIG